MKKILLIALLLVVGCSKSLDEESLIERGGVKYQQDSQKPYSGKVFRLYDTGENKNEGIEYGTVSPYFVRKILRKLLINQSDIIIDCGCGKGRVLLIASQYKFNKVIGIEFSPELIAIAYANIKRCKKYNNFNIDKIKIFEGDVLDYKFNNNESVFYLYNPFSNIILDKLCDHIVRSFNTNPRKILIAYVNPKFHNSIIGKGFVKIHEINLINKMCYIYSIE